MPPNLLSSLINLRPRSSERRPRRDYVSPEFTDWEVSTSLEAIPQAYEKARTRVTVLAILGLAFVYPRFWCRVLCPAGAFLALLNGIPRPKRLQPDIHPHACVFGVATPAELDCIRCDRCRCRGGLDAAQVRRDQRIAFRRTRNVVFIASVVCATAVLTAATLSTSPFRAARQASRQVTTGGAGQAKMRRVDVVRLKSLVEQGELSDREALYYHPHDPVAPVAPPPD